jgi:hypothetical protein
MPPKEKETIIGSKQLVIAVSLICSMIILAKLYYHWILTRYGYLPFRPLNPEEKSMIGLATLALIANSVALLGGRKLVFKMREKSFARKFNLVSIPFLTAVFYFLLPWPWWLVAAFVIIPIGLATESRRPVDHP